MFPVNALTLPCPHLVGSLLANCLNLSLRGSIVPTMAKTTSFSHKLTDTQQETLFGILNEGNYRPYAVDHARIAVKSEGCNIVLYNSGKVVIQGKEAEDFVSFVLEPNVLGAAILGYEAIVDPEASKPHLGVDESGKGDFFGPLVTACAYVDAELYSKMQEMGVKDSKAISSDDKALGMGCELRRMLGKRFAIVKIGPASYNRLYAKMKNVNTILSWAHARSIENMLDVVPDCPRAVSDQFGSKQQVERALMKKGRSIKLVQMHKAESDMAVAAASIIAREGFLRALKDLEKKYGMKIPKGASAAVREAAVALIGKAGPQVLIDVGKCHFKTADAVLSAAGASRKDLGPDGQAVSRTIDRPFKARKSS
jgi:ribonuclease HIII